MVLFGFRAEFTKGIEPISQALRVLASAMEQVNVEPGIRIELIPSRYKGVGLPLTPTRQNGGSGVDLNPHDAPIKHASYQLDDRTKVVRRDGLEPSGDSF